MDTKELAESVKRLREQVQTHKLMFRNFHRLSKEALHSHQTFAVDDSYLVEALTRIGGMCALYKQPIAELAKGE